MALRYLGKGTTDEHGVAHLTEDASGSPISPAGYTGVGAGEIDVVASVDKPIASGSVVSEPYSLLDTLFYDSGTDSTKTWSSSANASLSRGDDDSTVTQTDSSSFGYIYETLSSIEGICIEMDIKVTDNSQNLISFRQNSTNLKAYTGSALGLTNGTYAHVKFSLHDGKAYVNDLTNGDSITNANRFYLLVNGGITVNFKNLVIYPL